MHNTSLPPVIVGMSGGVDSSAAAFLLKEQGYPVTGVTMRMWQPDEMNIPGTDLFPEAEDAKKVAEVLGIPHIVLDFRQEFSSQVIQNFVSEYRKGRTPNPCIVCNRHVKWEALLQKSRELGAEYIATGHYAGIIQLENGRYAIRNAASSQKDQTYALYRLTQEQLSRTLMPVGEYTKEQIRQIAEKAGLPVAGKKDSQEICFVPDGDYAAYVERAAGFISEPGNFVTPQGEILGRHRGIIHYTVGQRRGLDLPMGRRVFVTEIRPETNEVVVGEQEDVWTRSLRAERLCFMGIPPMDIGEEGCFLVKIRYNHKGSSALVRRTGEDEITCIFDEPVKAVTPGQAAVLYRDGYVAAGGTIC